MKINWIEWAVWYSMLPGKLFIVIYMKMAQWQGYTTKQRNKKLLPLIWRLPWSIPDLKQLYLEFKIEDLNRQQSFFKHASDESTT